MSDDLPVTQTVTHEHTSLLSPDAILATAAPTQPIMTGIYFLIRDGRIVYVGQSWNIVVRVASHASTKQFDSWAWIPCDREGLNSLERAYLNALLPEYNTDPTTMRLKGGWPRQKVEPSSEDPWAGITKEQWAAVAALSEPQDELHTAQIEWMRRLRAMKADPKLRLKDFGPSPFYPSAPE